MSAVTSAPAMVPPPFPTRQLCPAGWVRIVTEYGVPLVKPSVKTCVPSLFARSVLPPDMSHDWADMSYQERKAPGVALVFGLAIFLVFLILAAQYESWGLPFSVLLGTPFAAFGAYLGLWLARNYISESYVNNVFAQIGLIMLIGLAAFNNLLMGVFMALIDAYGLSLVSVEAWGLLWGFISMSFIVGGLAVARFGLGRSPLRLILLGNLVSWIVSATFAPGKASRLDTEALAEARKGGVLVIYSTRAGSGRVMPRARLQEEGIVSADNLPAQKARVLGGNAASGVDHRHLDAVRHAARCDGDGAAPRHVPDRVVEEVAEHEVERTGIGEDLTCIAAEVAVQRHPSLRGALGEEAPRLVDRGVQRHLFAPRLPASALDLR